MIYMSMKNVKLIFWTIFVNDSSDPLNEKGNQHIYKVYAILAQKQLSACSEWRHLVGCKRPFESAKNSIRKIGLSFDSDWPKDSKVVRVFKF